MTKKGDDDKCQDTKNANEKVRLKVVKRKKMAFE